MDKNTVIGLVLIFAIIVGFSWLNRPNEEQIEAQKRYRDSIQKVELAKAQQAALLEELQQQKANTDTLVNAEVAKQFFGNFSESAVGEEQFVTVENDLLKLVFTTKGGRIYSAELKEYKTHDSLPLVLFDKDESILDFTFLSSNNRVLHTKDFYFEPTLIETENGQKLQMRLLIEVDKYLEFEYLLSANEYKVDFLINAHNMSDELDANSNSLEMLWKSKLKKQEKGRKFEARYATLNYKFTSDDVEYLNESKDDEKKLSNKIQWIAFKDQFFSTVLVANQSFTSTALESKISNNVDYLKEYKAEASVVFDPTGKTSTALSYLFIPNKYQTLKKYDKLYESEVDDNMQFRRLLPMGWSLFRWINEYLIIPIFNFFGKYISNYGIVIFLLTLVVKILIFPFTYKSYISSAKMRVLKPQIDEINAKYPPEKAMERQQATMNLYSRVGVSPMSGCLPMLFQMPILFAMFMFFPTCIELRQESFLWAKDLASYDAIFEWDAYIPLITPYFGNHISLFCLLMTITNIVYTKINMSSQVGAADQMKVMKWMMYLMPVMFMFIFNDYAAGLSYYYFISLLLTIVQTYLFRLFVDEEKLLKKLEANKKKPMKKSGFMARLEEAQRQQQKAMREQMKKKH
ncbi:MAG: membrane protein insertase YidC [Paludibacteraceae bacterium]|nr:membrane protein insertase YidC [Paludibacteraceae bacterium]